MKHIKPLLTFILLFAWGVDFCQTGIGTTNPDPSAALDVVSTTRGLLPPRMTEAQRDAIQNPASGLMIYNTDDNCLQVNVGAPQFPDWDCLARVAQPAEIAAFTNCAAAASGSFTEGVSSGGVKILHYTGGNGGQYNINVNSTGVMGLTVSAQGTLNFGEGDITLSISGIPNNGGTASFVIDINGVICNFDVEVTPIIPDALPGNITLTAGQRHIISSVLDSDYLPYTAPTEPATTVVQGADGTLDTIIDFQGTLSTTGVNIKIPYQVVNAPVNLPAFTQTITVPAQFIQDNPGGTNGQVTLFYPAQTLAVGTGNITATIKAETANLNVRKLDINNGIGNDYLGVLITDFTIATNNTGGTGTVELRALAGIPDRAFGDGTHNFLYMPITSSTGKTWLNNNLGANYNKLDHASFNPSQQATSSTDFNAYGGLYQWGRYSDGHELINWTSGTAGTPVNTSTSTTATGDTPGHGNFISITLSPSDWRVPGNDALWQGVSGTNNPCPVGFRLPTEAEITTEFTAFGINSTAAGYNSMHKLVTAGRHFYDGNLGQLGTTGNYWTSDISGTLARRRFIIIVNSSVASNERALGLSVRCIKD